jgi:hypothetical protein
MVSAYEIENECDDDCLVHRAYALPMVHAGVDQVCLNMFSLDRLSNLQLVATYEGSKRYSPTLASWLESVETTYQQTIDKTSPFYQKYLFSAGVFGSFCA